MQTIRELLSCSEDLATVSDTARLDVEILLSEAIKKDRTYLYTWPEKTISEDESKIFFQFLERRKNNEPIAYIIGKKEFWSLQLQCNTSTLIPRPETELLVELALNLLSDQSSPETSTKKILDLGTGTGAIALVIASEKPSWQVLAVDASSAAVQLAIENCRALGCKNVEITKSDWFNNVTERSFDCIISNPPYIEEGDKHLQQGDVRFEPHSALTSGSDGLQDIKQIIKDAPNYLSKGGLIMLEHGYNQAKDVAVLMSKQFSRIKTYQDLAGCDRVTIGFLNK